MEFRRLIEYQLVTKKEKCREILHIRASSYGSVYNKSSFFSLAINSCWAWNKEGNWILALLYYLIQITVTNEYSTTRKTDIQEKSK